MGLSGPEQWGGWLLASLLACLAAWLLACLVGWLVDSTINLHATPGGGVLCMWIRLDCIELAWLGLAWIGLDWIGLDWIGLLTALHSGTVGAHSLCRLPSSLVEP